MDARLDESGYAINLNLSRSDALLFFEFLARFNENDESNTYNHETEEQLLYDLEAAIEAALPEIVSEEYPTKLMAARQSRLGPA